MVASALMPWSPWPPALLGQFSIFLGLVCYLVFIPETLHLRPTKTPSTPPPSSPLTTSAARPTSLLALIKKQIITTLDSAATLNSLPVLLLLSTFSLVILALQIVQLALRDLSARFHWSLARTGYLLSFSAGINMVVVLAILPAASHLLTRPRYGLSLSTRAKDYFLTFASVGAMVLGCVILALSPPLPLFIAALAIFALGSGFMGLCRALITELVPRDHVGRLYAAIGVVEILGSVIGGPGLAKMYGIGLEWGGLWRGGPFWLVAVVGLWCVTALVWARRAEGKRRGEVDGEL
jgi:MFS family permease